MHCAKFKKITRKRWRSLWRCTFTFYCIFYHLIRLRQTEQAPNYFLIMMSGYRQIIPFFDALLVSTVFRYLFLLYFVNFRCLLVKNSYYSCYRWVRYSKHFRIIMVIKVTMMETFRLHNDEWIKICIRIGQEKNEVFKSITSSQNIFFLSLFCLDGDSVPNAHRIVKFNSVSLGSEWFRNARRLQQLWSTVLLNLICFFALVRIIIRLSQLTDVFFYSFAFFFFTFFLF